MALFDDWDDFRRAGPYDSFADGGRDSPFETAEKLDAGGHVSIAPTVAAPLETPLLTLEKYDTAVPAAIRHVAISSDVIAMALENGSVVRMDLASPYEDRTVMKFGQFGSAIHHVFLDPTGHFLVASLESGENYFVHSRWKKPVPKPISKTKVIVESIAWDAHFGSDASTAEILLGGRTGTLYEAVLDEKGKVSVFKQVVDLHHSAAVMGLHFEWAPSVVERAGGGGGDDGKDGKDGKGTAADRRGRCVVIASTPQRLYRFIGDRTGTGFESLFAAASAPAFEEAQSHSAWSELHVWRRHAAADATCVWLNADGLFHAMLDLDEDDPLQMPSLMPPPPLAGGDGGSGGGHRLRPMAFVVSEFFFILLYPGSVVAVSRLSGRATFTERLNVGRAGAVRGLCVDPVTQTRWLYTDAGVFEIVLHQEDRDVWRLYTENGQYKLALRHCKNDAQRQQVRTTQAEDLFSRRQFSRAARLFAEAGVSFERVALRFADAGERDALREYVAARLALVDSGDATQRALMATWLAEQHLHRVMVLEARARRAGPDDADEAQAAAADGVQGLREFLGAHRKSLDPTTMRALLASYGRTEDALTYAELTEDYERVLSHHLQRGDIQAALGVLSRTTPQVVYRFSPFLMERAPVETVSAWIANRSLEPRCLLPALVRYDEARAPPTDEDPEYQDVRYLRHCVRRLNNTDSAIHNMLLALYARRHDDARLLRFIARQGAHPLFDFNYALRMCMQNERWAACVALYSNMGLFAEAVELALKVDLALAKENADRPEDDPDLRRRLWLMIARHMVEEGDLPKSTAHTKYQIVVPALLDALAVSSLMRHPASPADALILWPAAVAPYDVYLVDLQAPERAKALHDRLESLGVRVLWDDRANAKMPRKLNDADLIGLRTRLMVARRMPEGLVEMASRRSAAADCADASWTWWGPTVKLPVDEAVARLTRGVECESPLPPPPPPPPVVVDAHDGLATGWGPGDDPEPSADQRVLLALLEELGIRTHTRHHVEVLTCDAHAAALPDRAAPDAAPGLGPFVLTKNLLVRDKKKQLFLLLARADDDVDTKRVGKDKTVGAASGGLRFADAESVQAALGVRPGSVTPLGLALRRRRDPAAGILTRVVMDERLAAEPRAGYHPLTPEATTVIAPDDLRRFVAACGYSLVVVPMGQ